MSSIEHKCRECGRIAPYVKFKKSYQNGKIYRLSLCNPCLNFKINPPKWKRREIITMKINDYMKENYV